MDGFNPASSTDNPMGQNYRRQVQLTDHEQAMAAGDQGEGVALAMSLVMKLAEIGGASQLVSISGAHIDGCLYHGQVGIDFVQQLADGGARVAVPTTLNVSSLDLLHPDLYRGDNETKANARLLMDLHVQLGCDPTWTCAPYQLATKPELGSQIAWGESNAIVFANSVLGARTNRYGDFADLACAITGRAPLSGLHTDSGRRATVVVDLEVEDEWLDNELFYPLLGYWIGATCGVEIPVIVGLDSRADEDRLKALGAAAASAGATAMFHALNVTPEASSLDSVAIGSPKKTVVRSSDIRKIRRSLGSEPDALGAVSVGTPHFSKQEFANLARLTEGRKTKVPFYVNTARSVVESLPLVVADQIADFGVTVVTDTCTYITPIMGTVEGSVMTNSAKWAYYAPGNLGYRPVFAGLAECVASADSGMIELSDPFT